MSYLFLGYALVAAVLVGAAIWMFAAARGQERQEDVLLRLRAAGQGSDDAALPTEGNRDVSNPVVRVFAQFFWRAGVEVPPRRMLLYALVAVGAAVFSALIAGLVGLAFVGILFATAYGVLLRMAARRRARIIEQLPGYLENVIRVLSAGNSLEESISSAARENAEPIRPLFLSVSRQAKLGAPIDQVMAQVGGLYRVRDLRVMALAASVNRKYGGSLRGVMKSLITTIRQRGTAARELRALTGETRFSAFFLALLPIGLVAFMYFRNPLYYVTMYKDPTGKLMLLGVLLWQVVGTFIIWRMMASVEDPDA